jgi:O-antigen ligase
MAPVMRTLSHPSVDQMDRGRWFVWLIGTLILIGSALLIGTVIAQEKWLLLGFATIMIVAFQWPIEIALGLYAFLLPFNSITALGDGKSGTTANYALGAIAGMAMLVTGVVRKRLTWPPRAALWWPLLLLWGVLTTAWALQPQVSVHELPTAIALVLLYLVAVSWRLTENEFSILTSLIIAGGCLAACYVVYQFAIGISYIAQYGATGRATMVVGSLETNPNTLGTDLLLPFSLAVAWFVSARRWWSTGLGLGAVSIIAYAVFLTMSRSSLLAIALVLGIYLFRLGFNMRILMIASGLLTLAFTMPATFFSRIQTMASSGGDGRLEIWEVGRVLLKRYGLLGAGLVNFSTAYTEYAGQASRFQGFGRGAHNLYLSTTVELGIVGFLLMLAAVTSHLLALRRLRPVSRVIAGPVSALECACWGMLTAAFFGDLLWEKSFWLIWMLSLMAVRLDPGHARLPARWSRDRHETQEWFGAVV